MQRNYRKIARFGIALATVAALLLLLGCMSMGPKSVITEPVFDLVALQRASMGEVAGQLGFDIDGEQSYVKKKDDKTIWKYNELDIRSNGGISLTGESSSLSYEFYFNEDDELYFVKIINYYVNSTRSASKNGANGMRRIQAKMSESFTEQLGVEPEFTEVTDSMVRWTWETDKNIKVVSSVNDEFDDGVADYGAVTEIRYYKEQ